MLAVVVAAVGATRMATAASSRARPVFGGEGVAAATGITLRTYTNMALSGIPSSTQILDTTAFSVPSGSPGSAELVGTIGFPTEGAVYHFDCQWAGTTMGFVWVDGHMVCQDGHACGSPFSATAAHPV